MSIKKTIKKVPGARWVHNRCVLGGRKIHRLIFGPGKGELYDIQTIEVMRRVLKRNSSTYLDIGAHKGDILRHALSIAPHGKHHAVEALPHLASRLVSEFPSVQVHNCAVADQDGEAVFNFVENDPAYSGLQNRTYPREPVIKQILVSVRRLDNLIPKEVQIDMIKCDIEGGEYHAFLGGVELFKRCKPVIVFECGLGAADFYKTTPEGVHDVLSSAGLKVSTMGRWLAGNPSSYSRDEFAVSYKEGHDFYYIASP